MEFLVLGIFVVILASLSLVPTYFIAKRRPKIVITFLPSLGLLLLASIMLLLSTMPREPGSWADLVFVIYALIAFYAFLVSIIGTFAINYYFKRQR
jgi:drug/metabolite transporter (DMT)-like permease